MRNSVIRLVVVLVGFSGLMLPVQSFAQGKSSSLLEEVIVTARKREENLQDAPIAVSAFTGDQLDFRGLSDIEKLDQFTPNLCLISPLLIPMSPTQRCTYAVSVKMILHR